MLSVGGKLRRCSACGSPATEIVCSEWDLGEGDVWARLHETCQECDRETEYHVTADFWAAMQAMAIWEQGRTARAAAEQMIANAQDLHDLDDGSGDSVG